MFYEKILNKAPLKILTLLSLHPDEVLYEREICKQTGLAVGTVNQAMRELLYAGIVTVSRKGKMNFYRVKQDIPLIRYHRIWDNLLLLQPLVHTLQKYCSRIILFGSGASGIDTHISDLDLLIVSEETPETLRRIISQHREIDRIINPVIYSISDYAVLIDEDAAFYKEIRKGILLHEKGTESDNTI